MPSHNPIDQPSHHEQQQQQLQVKVCIACHSTLADNASAFVTQLGAVVCNTCREHGVAQHNQQAQQASVRYFRSLAAQQPSRETRNAYVDTVARQPTESQSTLFDDGMFMDDVPNTPTTRRNSSSIPHPTPTKAKSLPIQRTPVRSTSPPRTAQTHFATNPYYQQQQHHSASTSNPLTDISRLRVRSHGHYCLHPGSIFQGTQKSGRNSYDVTVTIVDVDFSSSFLCGYLRIRGLTDDWPELTTYFDAEIIGSRYGFLTQNWGASEQDDLVHWGRFPAFKNLRPELRKPHLKMADRDRGAVFMRWKERFLVPDHRVQDINGASFAGFYYICVDFNNTPSSPMGSRAQSLPIGAFGPEVDDSPLVGKLDNSSLKPQCDSPVSSGEKWGAIPNGYSTSLATMSGFYYHQNSEPYQQLSLCHVPERTSSSFEFR